MDYYICVDEEESMRIKSLSEISDDDEDQTNGNGNTENSQESADESNFQPNSEENSQESADTEKIIKDFMETVDDEINF